MLGKFLHSLRRGQREARVPDGLRIYAIGDIHGRVDLLRILHHLIANDKGERPNDRLVIYLGDYVDRGLDSRGVIDFFLDEHPRDLPFIALKGNHEEMMLRFLDDISVGPGWLEYGGAETLLSYGVSLSGPISEERTLIEVQRRLLENVPSRHIDFMLGSRLYHVAGDYLFVHAGIRPGKPLEAQVADDMLWIRGDFLRSGDDHGYVVVHGHSIKLKVDFRPNRIGIDTGAYATGVLTCLVLEGGNRRLLQTGQ
jgi:serine/threonine protein phosphatase 1